MTNVAKAKEIFQTSLLPELLGKFYSHDSIRQHCQTANLLLSQESSCSGTSMDTIEYHQDSIEEVEDDNVKLQLYCYCQRSEEGNIVVYDNSSVVSP